MVDIELSALRESALISMPQIIARHLDIVVIWVMWLTNSYFRKPTHLRLRMQRPLSFGFRANLS